MSLISITMVVVTIITIGNLELKTKWSINEQNWVIKMFCLIIIFIVTTMLFKMVYLRNQAIEDQYKLVKAFLLFVISVLIQMVFFILSFLDGVIMNSEMLENTVYENRSLHSFVLFLRVTFIFLIFPFVFTVPCACFAASASVYMLYYHRETIED